MLPLIAIDYDGTLVESTWPRHGPWLPGAIESLRELQKFARVTIFTMRASPYEIDGFTERPLHVVRQEVMVIEERLSDAGLRGVTVWQRMGKPPAIAFIDDRGIRFNGRNGAWPAIVTRCKIMCNQVLDIYPEYEGVYEPVGVSSEVVQ